MEYRCSTISAAEMVIGPKGVIMPLCEDCCTVDCDNPIEKTQVSLVGITHYIKVYNRGVEPRFVMQCQGYLKK